MDRSESFLESLRLWARQLLARTQSLNSADFNRSRRYSRLQVLFRLSIASFVLALFSLSILFLHSYRGYAKIVDARLAHGYLTSRGGIYAAPRVLRPGQKLTRDGLAAALHRSGYIEGNDAGEVWNGSFAVRDNAIEIHSNNGVGPAAVVQVTFDPDGRILHLMGDDLALDSFTLEPESLTNDSTTNGGAHAH